VFEHLPRDLFLIVAGRCDRRAAVHQFVDQVLVAGGEEALDRQQADQALILEHGDLVGVLEGLADQRRAHGRRGLAAGGYRYASGRVFFGDTELVLGLGGHWITFALAGRFHPDVAVLDGCIPGGSPQYPFIYTGRWVIDLEDLTLPTDKYLSSFTLARNLKPLKPPQPCGDR
jgi:hypothetical protein